MSTGNLTTTLAARQRTTPKLTATYKPYELAIRDVIASLDKGIRPDVDSVDLGNLRADIDDLIAAFDAGEYATARPSFFKFHKRLAPLAAVTAPDQAEEKTVEDPRKMVYPDGRVGFKGYTMKELRSIPRARWLLGGILLERTVSMTYGDSNTGKTFLMVDIALYMAYGMDLWHGDRKVKAGKVLYIYAEGGAGLWDRVYAFQKHYDKGDTENIMFIPFPVQFKGEIDDLRPTIDAMGGVDLVIFDTFSVCANDVNENDNLEIASCINAARSLIPAYGCHVNIVHHVGKNGLLRGASAFKGNTDTLIFLSSTDVNAPIRVECGKQRDRAHFEPFYLELQVEDLGIDEETLESISSCVVVPGNNIEQYKQQSDREQQTMLTLLAKNPNISDNKWKKLCSAAGIGSGKYDGHKTFMLNHGMIHAQSQGTGKATLYNINSEYEGLVDDTGELI